MTFFLVLIQSAFLLNTNTLLVLLPKSQKTKFFYKEIKNIFLGGSLIDHGGQNPLEATKYSCNIIHGPNVHNFKEIYNFLNQLKISHKVTNKKDLTLKLLNLFKRRNKSNKHYLKLKSIGKKTLTAYYNELNLNQ